MSTVAVAMTDGLLGCALAADLASVAQVVAPALDGFSLPEAEVAFAGVDALVLVPSSLPPAVRLVQAEANDLETLRVDTFSRAARRAGVARVVLVLGAPDGAGLEALVRASGVKVSLVQASSAAEACLAVRVALGLPSKVAGEHALAAAPQPSPAEPASVCSVQRLPLPSGWSAQQAAAAYFSWLSKYPLLSVERLRGRFTVTLLGVALLRLAVDGTGPDGSWALKVSGGALAQVAGHFEFRVLATGGLITALVGFRPRLPWPLYRFTQAVAHRRVMRAFGRWLERQPAQQALSVTGAAEVSYSAES